MGLMTQFKMYIVVMVVVIIIINIIAVNIRPDDMHEFIYSLSKIIWRKDDEKPINIYKSCTKLTKHSKASKLNMHMR